MAGRVFLQGDKVVVGRHDEKASSSSPDISPPENPVGRRHSRIFTKNGHYFLEYPGSTNGTFLNGSNVARQEPVKDAQRK